MARTTISSWVTACAECGTPLTGTDPLAACGNCGSYERQSVNMALYSAGDPAARNAVVNKDWRFWEFVDKTTPNHMKMPIHAASEADALGVARRYYRQKGNKFPVARELNLLEDEPEFFYRWTDSGDKKHIELVPAA